MSSRDLCGPLTAKDAERLHRLCGYDYLSRIGVALDDAHDALEAVRDAAAQPGSYYDAALAQRAVWRAETSRRASVVRP